MSQPGTGFDVHSPAWIFQAWVAFIAAVATTAIGIAYLPVDRWMQGFLGMGLLFSIGSTFTLAKTVRDLHEARRAGGKVDYATYEKMLAEHHPLR
jgi:hypothetical protein